MRSRRGPSRLRPTRIKYLLRDEFRGARAAGAVHGTPAEPGPGTRTVVDTNTVASITGGDLSFPQGAGYGDPGVVYGDIPITRVAGRMLIADLLTPGQYPRLAWNVSPSSMATTQWKQSIGFFDNAIESYGSEGILAVGTVTDSVRYTVWLILRANGYFAFIKGGTEYPHPTLIFPFSAGSEATLYAGLAGSSGIGTRLMSFIRIPERLLLPNPFAYDTFVRANGAPGSSEAAGPDGQPVVQRSWLGAGLAIDTNELKNTPTAGAELWDAAAAIFTSGTYAWAALGGNTIENDANTLKITYVDDGGGAKCFFRDAADLSSDLTVGTWYQLQVDAKVNAGTAGFTIVSSAMGIGLTFSNTTMATKLVTFRAGHATTDYIRNQALGAGEIIWLDNLSLKPLTLSTLFGSLQTAAPDVVVDAKVKAMPLGTQAGIVARLDSDTNPQNCVIAYFNGGRVRLEEMASGTWQAVILNVEQAFTADDTLRLDLSGTAYRLYLITDAGVATLLGSGTVTVTTGSKHGVFSTCETNRVDIVNVMPKGTAGEYEWLSKY